LGEAVPIQPKRVLISYAWDDDKFRQWVRELAARLRADGVDVRLDAWNLEERDHIPEFMNREIRLASRVLVLCSPAYQAKVRATEDGARVTGVGWESRLLSGGELAANESKIIVALARGPWRDAAPDFLLGKRYWDLSDPSTFETHYRELLREITETTEKAPPLGSLPDNLAPPPTVPLRGYQSAGAERWANPIDGTVLIRIPASSFMMGNSVGRLAAHGFEPNPLAPTEWEPHTVFLSDFWIARTPITNAQYKRYCQTTDHPLPQRIDHPAFNGDDHPVIGISWYEAERYLKWAQLEFPSEAQWERTAAGLSSFFFPWGDSLPTNDHGNFHRHNPGTTPVTRWVRGATIDGVLDLFGNVLEWCLDDTMDFQPRDMINPMGPCDSQFAAIRGGSFARSANQCRASYRDRRMRTDTWGSTSLRAALTTDPRGRQ
jgi:formylglycine-generating enzyme required for sulfatase activity